MGATSQYSSPKKILQPDRTFFLLVLFYIFMQGLIAHFNLQCFLLYPIPVVSQRYVNKINWLSETR